MDPRATVFLPTFNSERYLAEILDALFQQKLDHPFEVLVIDSGSTDSTLSILARYPNVRLLRIPNQEFQHGRTRNLAAREARGRIIVYLTASATPVGQDWLKNLIRHFDEDPRVAAVFGKHLPRPDCNPYVAYDIERTFAWISPEGGMRKEALQPGETLESLPLGERHRRRFYSDANSALRKSYWQAHPYPEVDYAEDQLMGAQVLETGYVKVYDPDAAVYHSHSYPPMMFFRRRFDEFRGLVANGEKLLSVSLWSVFRSVGIRWLRLMCYVLTASRYRISERAIWMLGTGLYAMLDQLAMYLSQRQRRIPSRLLAAFSLETSQKKKGIPNGRPS